MKKGIKQNTIKNSIKVLIAVLALFLFNIDAKADFVKDNNYSFTGNVQEFIAPYSGIYKLETWGAQGAEYQLDADRWGYREGFGGYSTGEISLQAGDKLYITVGGQGKQNRGSQAGGAGGYNGGGSGGNSIFDYYGGAGGGGATHISTTNRGVLKNFNSYRNEIVIVAGGGGGNGYGTPAGSGGGFKGGSTGLREGFPTYVGGTQDSGYAFGQGQNGRTGISKYMAEQGTGGGGGGYYGGYANQNGADANQNVGGSGGSGYIGYSQLTNKKMVCYNCPTSGDTNTKTDSKTQHSATALSNQVKEGDGAAKVQLVSAKSMLDSLVIKTGWLEEEFNKYKTDYTWIIPKGVNELSSYDIESAIPSFIESDVIFPNGSVPFTQDGDTFEIEVISSDSSERTTYTLTMQRYVSNDATLSDLTSDIGQFTKPFNADDREFTLEIFDDVDKVQITPVANEQDAVVSDLLDNLGEVSLDNDETDYEFIVTAENGDIETYTVHIRKNMYLKNIEIKGLENISCDSNQCTLSPEFTPEEDEYVILVPQEYTNLVVDYTPSSSSLRVGVRVNNTVYNGNYAIESDISVVKFNIYNNSNSIVKTYTVNIVRESDRIRLKKLDVIPEKGYLVEDFNKNKFDYTWVIPKNVTTLTEEDIIVRLYDSNSSYSIIPENIIYHEDGDKFKVTVKSKIETNYTFTGNVQEFTAPYTGIYKLEAWGAQGAEYQLDADRWGYREGFGGYSTGEISLQAGDKLYITVGGQGKQNRGSQAGGAGGYNGGGSGGNSIFDYYGGAGGGGATHISNTNRGELKNFNSYRNEIIIVAGGGGGNGNISAGGSGGGYIGASSQSKTWYDPNSNVTYTTYVSNGGSQSTGYGFGLGQRGRNGFANMYAEQGAGGGGGGYFGGYASQDGTSSATAVGGGGGSGYIGYSGLTNKKMVGYKVTPSSDANTKTDSTTRYSATPTSDYAKQGDGYARITFMDEDLLSRTYTLTLEKEKSDDARLATLTATTPTSEPNFPNGFDKDQTDPVIIEVYNNVFEITLDGTPYEQDATVIDGLGTIELNEDEVEHNITVQAENGDIRVYQVIIRKNMYIEDMGLTSTSLEGKACKAGECVLEPTFDPGTTEYFIKVPVDYDNLYAYYSLPDTHHTSVMTVDGNPYVDGYELPVEGTVVVKVDVYNDDPDNNQVVKTYTMRVIKEVEYQQEFDYTGDYQVFIAPFTGKYKMETWGAQGAGGSGGKGAYTSGYINLTKGEKLYVYVGEQGKMVEGTIPYGTYSFNGGSGGSYAASSSGYIHNYYGGSATDIRLKSGNWDNEAGLASRIMVSAGGSSFNYSQAGMPGGTLNGLSGGFGTGGTQTSGGGPRAGSFGKAGIPAYNGNSIDGGDVVAGAGSGYYGGGAYDKVAPNATGQKAAGSGSSYVSGYLGAVAIKGENDISPKSGCSNGTTNIECSYHYSGKIFTKPEMIAGNQTMPTHDGTGTMTGNSGNGYAKISYIPEIENRIDYDYTGDYQTFIAPTTGKYKMETWGAQGFTAGNYAGGKGAYTSGYIDLHKDEVLYIYVGEKGIAANNTRAYGTYSFNGGSGGSYLCYSDGTTEVHNDYGGSATDIRLNSGNWYDTAGLASRIMVSAGGSSGNWGEYGAPGGTLTGIDRTHGTGGTQTSGGGPNPGSFGKAGIPAYNADACWISAVESGAGSGYYGGGAYNLSGSTSTGQKAAGSGSSFISGHPGAVAITAEDDLTPKTGADSNVHYSGKVFTDTVMKAGNEIMPSTDGVTSQVGNNGDGHAAITLIEVEVKLDELTVDYGALTESFDKNKNDYVWQIPKDTDHINKEDIHYVPSNPDSTVTDTLPINEVHEGDVIEITVTGDDGVTTNVYTLTVEYIKDTDNRLRILESDKGVFTPEFNPDTNSYVLEIYEYLDEVTLTGEPMSVYSTVVGLGTIDMEEDIVEHEIIVTAEDGTVNVYNVTIKKDAYLLYLGLNGLDTVPCVEDECTLVPPFEPSSNEYSIKVPYEYETLDVYYLTSTPEHSVKIKVNDSEVSNYSLPEGDTLVTVELYNKNNILVNTYTMNVNRAKGNYATLETLEVSEGELNVPFAKDIEEYTWILPDNISDNLEDYISYTTTDPGATVELIPSSISYTGEGSKFDIKVTAEDGVTTKTYTINLQQDIIEDIEVEENMLLTVGETKNLYINGLPEGSVGKYLYEVDQNAIILVDDYGDVYGMFPGEATVTISVKNHPEITSKVVHVTVISDKITSQILSVEDRTEARIIIGEDPETYLNEFIEKIDNPEEYLVVYDKDGNEIDKDTYEDTVVGTGMKVKLVIDGIEHDEVTVVVRGDIDGDGFVDITDASFVSDHVLGLGDIEGIGLYAADLEEDGFVDVSDDAIISDYILGLRDSLNE